MSFGYLPWLMRQGQPATAAASPSRMFNPLAWLGQQGYGDLVRSPEEAQALLEAQLGMGPRMPMGMAPNPEMGGGAARDVGLRTVDALGPQGNAVNSASAVAAGGVPTGLDTMADAVGWGGPNGGGAAAGGNAMMALLPLAMSLFSKGNGEAPPPPPTAPLINLGGGQPLATLMSLTPPMRRRR
ncbi:MAG TPA: hypothetical protein VD995_04670 [Azospirillum sp.]|nr:hypothetical protein [Azospirillum sp.]